MREIKFRAWFKNEYINGIMREFGLGQDYFQEYAMDNEDGELKQWTFELEDAKAIMQYTGLKDKNGKEIYEGDIVNVFNYEINEWQYAGVIEWINDFVCFYINRQYALGVKYKYEIIGNIYENPELL